MPCYPLRCWRGDCACISSFLWLSAGLALQSKHVAKPTFTTPLEEALSLIAYLQQQDDADVFRTELTRIEGKLLRRRYSAVCGVLASPVIPPSTACMLHKFMYCFVPMVAAAHACAAAESRVVCGLGQRADLLSSGALFHPMRFAAVQEAESSNPEVKTWLRGQFATLLPEDFAQAGPLVIRDDEDDDTSEGLMQSHSESGLDLQPIYSSNMVGARTRSQPTVDCDNSSVGSDDGFGRPRKPSAGSVGDSAHSAANTLPGMVRKSSVPAGAAAGSAHARQARRKSVMISTRITGVVQTITIGAPFPHASVASLVSYALRCDAPGRCGRECSLGARDGGAGAKRQLLCHHGVAPERATAPRSASNSWQDVEWESHVHGAV